MQMIDVLKRLAELDAQNPNVVNENSQKVDECGMMPGTSMPMDRPSVPATINMTAASAAELGDLLKDIVSLAGMNKDSDMEPMAVSPVSALEPASSGMDAMRSVLDKLNDSGDSQDDQDDERQAVGEYDNTPNDPVNDVDEFDPDQHAHQENQPGQGDRMDGDRPKAYADMNEAVTDLFAQYKKFVSEN